MKKLLVITFVLFSTSALANPVNTFTNWLTNEKNDIVEYQKENWQKGKDQLANTKQSIVNLFKKVTNASQN
tara:strand:+ start:74 stop:286 length:213 start_codon:yes stop_codon:yes gene_type:complete